MNKENKIKLLRGLKVCVADLTKIAEESEEIISTKLNSNSKHYIDMNELKKLAEAK